MNRLQAAEQLRRALQLVSSGLTDAQSMEVASIFDPWQIGKAYSVGDKVTYGVNGVGDPQLYRVNQAHTAQDGWKPDQTPAIYTAIGLDDNGYPMWSQPSGAHDAYSKGDIVNYNGVLYESVIDGNTYSPEAYPEGWKSISE